MIRVRRLFSGTAKARAALKAASTANVAATARHIEQEAKARAPVDEGELKAGIHAEVSGNEATVVSEADHSVFVNFGTYKDPAQPYFSEAASSGGQEFKESFRNLRFL